MANSDHLDILKQGVETWNRWRKDQADVRPDLSGANLPCTDLSGGDNYYECLIVPSVPRAPVPGADLSGVNCKGARLWKANLAGTIFAGVDLEHSDLRQADLTCTVFDGANLKYATLDGAITSGTRFVGANLLGASMHLRQMGFFDLTGATIGYSKFGDIDFRRVAGLETLIHQAPSTLGIQSCYKSDGRIPASFLRDAGVPDVFISQIKSLVAAMDPIQFYSCFISYSTKDREFAAHLHTDLQDNRVRCWFAPHNIKGGTKIHEQIDEAIRIYDRLLLILSDHSMTSEWVKTEIAHARQKELNENRQVLFPISLVPVANLRDWKCFDVDTGKDSAREIREYFIPDFSNWKDHDAYQHAFQRLVRDLSLEENMSPGAPERS